MTCIVVIGILAALLLPGFSSMRERARSVQCTNNLKNLYVAASSYIQENQHWPQVVGKRVSSAEFADAWLKELQPYNIEKQNWLCPTITANTANFADLPFRLDYIPTPFGIQKQAPFRWPTHPWFSERGSVHGKGNLIILGNGSVKPLSEITASTQPPE